MIIKVNDYYIDNSDITRITPVYINSDKNQAYFHIYFKYTGHYERILYDIRDCGITDIKILEKLANVVRDNIAASIQPHLKITNFELELNNNGE
jgi:hypothetical protein